MGKLIVHIGPPKTATTSLQYYWQNLNDDRLKYLGVNQPRENISLGAQISKYLSIESFSQEQYFKYKLAKIVSTNKVTLISEEVILLEQSNFSIEAKLIKLSKIIDKKQAIITFGVRDPSVYFSYYLEIYHLLPKDLQNDFDKFQISSYCDCFKYEKLIKLIYSIGFKNIHYFDFENLISHNLCLNEILGTRILNWNYPIKITKENSTSKKNNTLSVTKNSNLKNFIHLISPNFLKNKGFGTYFNHLSIMKKNIKLERMEVLEEIKKNYKSDLTYFNSIEKRNSLEL